MHVMAPPKRIWSLGSEKFTVWQLTPVAAPTCSYVHGVYMNM